MVSSFSVTAPFDLRTLTNALKAVRSGLFKDMATYACSRLGSKVQSAKHTHKKNRNRFRILIFGTESPKKNIAFGLDSSRPGPAAFQLRAKSTISVLDTNLSWAPRAFWNLANRARRSLHVKLDITSARRFDFLQKKGAWHEEPNLRSGRVAFSHGDSSYPSTQSALRTSSKKG